MSQVTQETPSLPARKRMDNYDVLRIIACFFVIVNHTHLDFAQDGGPSFSWLLHNFYFNMCRMNVPTFIIISGGLLLGVQEPARKWAWRVGRMVLVILVFSCVQFVFQMAQGTQTLAGLPAFLLSLISGPPTNAYWFLYMYLGLMLMLPLLRVLAQHMTKRLFHYYFLLFAFFQCTYPFLVYYLGFPPLSPFLALPLVSGSWFNYISFILIGYYLRYHVQEGFFRVKGLLVAVPLYIVCVAIPTAITAYDFFALQRYDLFMDNPFFLTAVIATLCVYYTVTALTLRFPPRGTARKVLGTVSASVFGIYLFHEIAITLTRPLFTWLSAHMFSFVALVLWELVIFALCCVLVILLRLIPPVRRLL